MTIVQTALNLVLSITFTFAFGLAGPLLGTTAAFMAVSVWYMPMLMSEMFEVPASRLILLRCRADRARAARHMRPLLIGWCAPTAPPAGSELRTRMLSVAVVYLLLAWLVVFHPEERASLMSRFRMVLRAATA